MSKHETDPSTVQPFLLYQVGIKFQYFDLHPVYDHLEVKEEETAEVARYFKHQGFMNSFIKVGKYITCHPPSLLTTGPGSTETPQSAQSSPALIT